MAVGKGGIEQKTGYELIKNSVSNKTQQLLAPFNEGISSLYDQIKDALKLKQAAQKIEDMANKAEEFTNQKLTDLALSIDPSLVVNGGKSKKNNPNDTGQTVGEDDNSKQINNVINQANSTKQTPEKSNKEDFLDFNKAKERISSENKLSTLWVGQNKAIESLENHDAVDNIQAAALVYIHNGINSGDTINHSLSPAGEIKLATVLAVELLQSMKLNDKQLADLSAKLTNNPASKKIGIGGTIADVTKGIQDSGVMDVVSGATSFMKVFNGAKPILEKANTMMDLLREGSSKFDAKNMSISQFHQLYQSCINKSFPSTEQIATITKQTQTDTTWYASKLTSLTISPAALTFIKEHLTELPFLDAESTKKTQELAKSVEEGMDSVYDVVGQWFGVEKGSAMMDKWIESLMKFFDNPFLGALANMAGIDLSKIKQTLSGEFTPAQEEQLNIVMKKYVDSDKIDGEWNARLGGWISNTTSERYKALEKFNMKYLNDHLGAATPHVSVVQSLVGNDETLKAKYLTTKSVTKDGVTTEQVVVKEGVLDNADNKKELAGLFCANDIMVKSVIDSTKWTTSQDVAGLLTAQWMKGDIRGVRAWTKYQEKQAKINPTEGQKKQQNSENTEIAAMKEGDIKEIGDKIVGPGVQKMTNSWSKDTNSSLIGMSTETKGQVGQLMTIGRICPTHEDSQFLLALDQIKSKLQWSDDQYNTLLLTMGAMKHEENWSNGNFNQPKPDANNHKQIGPWAFARVSSDIKGEFGKMFKKSIEKYGLDETKIAKDSLEYYAIGMLEQFETREGAFAGTDDQKKLGAINAMANLNWNTSKEQMKDIVGTKVQGSQGGATGIRLWTRLRRPLSDFVDLRPNA